MFWYLLVQLIPSVNTFYMEQALCGETVEKDIWCMMLAPNWINTHQWSIINFPLHFDDKNKHTGHESQGFDQLKESRVLTENQILPRSIIN